MSINIPAGIDLRERLAKLSPAPKKRTRKKKPVSRRRPTPRPVVKRKPTPKPAPAAKRKPVAKKVAKPNVKTPNIRDLLKGGIFDAVAKPKKKTPAPKQKVNKKVSQKKPSADDIRYFRDPVRPPGSYGPVAKKSYEREYIDWAESKPKPPRKIGGMGKASKAYQNAIKKYRKDLKDWQESKPAAPTQPTSAPVPAPIAPPVSIPAISDDMPNKYADRFFRPTSTVATPDSLVPRNIVGQSYDPSFAASFAPPPQPPGSVFGGYGQQAPMAALAPYAGMAQSQPMPTDFFPSYVPKPDPIILTDDD